MTNAEILYEFFRAHPKWKCSANEGLLLTNAQRPLTVQTLAAAAARLGDRLAVSGDYARAYSVFFAAHPEIEDCDATRDILDAQHHGDDVTAESLEELLQIPRIRAMLPESTAHAAERQEQAERERLISEIALGKTTYGAYRPQHGDIKWYQSSHLVGESMERLVEIHQIVTSQRSAVVERQSGAPQVNTTKPTAQAETFNELINPATGREYTATELKRLDRSDYRRILCLPSGQVKAPVAARITQILKGLA